MIHFHYLAGVELGAGEGLGPPVQQQPRHAVVAEPRGLVQRRPAGLVSLVNAGPGLQQQLHDVWEVVRDLCSISFYERKQDANVIKSKIEFIESTNKRPFLSRVARGWGWRVCARRRTRRGRGRSRRGRWSAAGRPAAAAPAPARGCRRGRRSGTPSSCRPAPAG